MKRAFSARLYYPALLVALTLPDICAGLELPDTVFVKERHYANFVDTYTEPARLGLNGLQCYRLRCGVVHRGNAAQHPFFGRTHVVFTVPETGAVLHGFSIVGPGEAPSAAMIDLGSFCDAMEDAVRKWYVAHASDAQVQESLPKLLSWRPEGIYPFVAGAVVGSGV